MTARYVRSQQTGQSTPGSGTYRGAWQSTQTWAVGDRMVNGGGAQTGYVYECTTGGAGSVGEPTWGTTLDGTTADNVAVWTCRAPNSWANATITLYRVSTIEAAGDVIYVRNDHSESTAGAVTYDWAGTAADPTRIICVSDSNEPPTTIATGAVVAVTGNNNLTLVSSNDAVYFYGIRFKAGDGTNIGDVIAAVGSPAAPAVFESCAFELAGNSASSDFEFRNVWFVNCTFKSANAGSSLWLQDIVYFYSGSIESGGTPGAPFLSNNNLTQVLIDGFDFSNLSSSASLIADGSIAKAMLTVRNCKMPSSWSGSVNSSTPAALSIFSLHNCDSSDTNYRLQHKTQFGEIVHETTIKRTGGASDGTTGLSWKMVSGANAEWSHLTLDTPEIVKWNETTGSSVTATVEFVHDSVTNLTDKEIWLEVMYLGTSGYPLGSTVSDAAANYLSSGADQTDSSETWTTTGLTNPNTQKLSVTFTPQEKGFVHAVVKLAAASKTVYVDPVLTIA